MNYFDVIDSILSIYRAFNFTVALRKLSNYLNVKNLNKISKLFGCRLSDDNEDDAYGGNGDSNNDY